MTICMIVGLVVYLSFMVSTVIHRSQYTTTSTRIIRNLYTDDTLYNFTKETFDYGVYLAYRGNDPNVTNLH